MLPKRLYLRETSQVSPDSFRRKHHMPDDFLKRLGYSGELAGHQGCVNCLQWSQSGDLLISGSDDCNVHIWQPHRNSLLRKIPSEHSGNIFSVKFMPYSNDTVIASAAADAKVNILNVPSLKCERTFNDHYARVKRLEVCQTDPYLLWSAAEDGFILQMDVRCSQSRSQVLVNLNGPSGKFAEAKCLSINPFRNELLAVGANDAFVRLFDRRMIKPREIPQDDNGVQRHSLFERKRDLIAMDYIDIEAEAQNYLPQYFIPGHLKRDKMKGMTRRYVSTFVHFSPDDGNELLVNLGGEQIYIFNLNRNLQPLSAKGFDMMRDEFKRNPNMSEEALQMKDKANSEFEHRKYNKAIYFYNLALQTSNHPVLYSNRAAARIKRDWNGDSYAAYRDCLSAVSQDSGYVKAHLRLLKCLIEMERLDEAEVKIEEFKKTFPEQSEVSPLQSLMKSMREKREKLSKKKKDSQESRSSIFDGNSDSEEMADLERMEEKCREKAFDYTHLFSGHCNMNTDIKEAIFLGSNCEYITAGSDEGYIFIWEKSTGNIVKILNGDDNIVNCLQCHPNMCLLATSGIDSVVRLWTPLPKIDSTMNDRTIHTDPDEVTEENHRKMNADPFENMIFNIPHPVGADNDEAYVEAAIPCRPS